MTAKCTNLSAIATILTIVAVTIFAVPITAGQSDTKDDLYATAISGGKTKPLVDIESRLKRPDTDRAIKKAEPTTRRVATADTTTIEDASKYQLYIEPVYPRKARVVNKEGIVEVNITFDKKGKMKDAKIVSCSAPDWGFEQAVLAAALEAKLSGHGEREITVKATLKFQLR
jgi:TonB family protein